MDKITNKNSTKDLSQLTDIFQWNLMAYKKASHFYDEIADEEIKKELMIVSSMHKDLCDKIENILK